MQLNLPKSRRGYALLGLVLVAVLGLPGMSLYYQATGGRACARCHEIWQPYTDWRTSTHRIVACTECHGDVLTVEAGFHLGNIRRLVTHLRGSIPEKIRIKDRDMTRTMARCQKCHQQEYANWQAGPHSATYAEMFLNTTHNQQRLLMDDCLRCHGMHFEGSIRELVTPLNTQGPWRLLRGELAHRPAIPCFTCHRVHHEGQPLAKPPKAERPAASTEEIHRPSLSFFDRRQLTHISASNLPLPAMREGVRRVMTSPDRRQGLCYQCHAPLATFEVNSGDDRTALGVHEGLSCLACHQKHRQTTRASCATCHPQLSNCGLDVETMDTTFRSAKSRHNIHFVKCADCHPAGVPRKSRSRVERVPRESQARTATSGVPSP